MKTSFLCFALSAALAAPLAGQTPLHAQFSPPVGDHDDYFALSNTVLGDVDGDGVPDYAAAATNSANESGYVVVYSGGTGLELVTLTGPGGVDCGGNGDRFGSSVAGLGDVDGDQVPDILVGCMGGDTYIYNGGLARVLSGNDWSLIREHAPVQAAGNYGKEVGALGDVNGDGASEYLVAEGTQFVHCYDGATGVLLWTNETHLFDQGTELSPTVGDANGDGVPDALIGAPAWYDFHFIFPYALVLDGATGAQIHSVSKQVGATSFGRHVAWVGDVNGDDRDEFAVGAPADSGGEVIVYDGATGASLYTVVDTPIGGNLGHSFCGMGDQDGDGTADLAVDDGGVPLLFSGADGTLIGSYHSFPMTTPATLHSELSPAGDLDGDGKQDLLAGIWNGNVLVAFLSSEHLFEDLGLGLAGTLADPVLTTEGSLEAGSILRLALSGASPWTPAYLFIGFSRVDLPFYGGTLVPSVDVLVDGLVTDISGSIAGWTTVPAGIPGGTEFILQFWMINGGGPFDVTASNAVRSVFP